MVSANQHILNRALEISHAILLAVADDALQRVDGLYQKREQTLKAYNPTDSSQNEKPQLEKLLHLNQKIVSLLENKKSATQFQQQKISKGNKAAKAYQGHQF